MSSNKNSNILIETLKAQAEIFGDELYFSMDLKNSFLKQKDEVKQMINTIKKSEISEEDSVNFKFNFMSNNKAKKTTYRLILIQI